MNRIDPQIKEAIEAIKTSLTCIAEMQTLPKELSYTVRGTVKFHRQRVDWCIDALRKAGVLK